MYKMILPFRKKSFLQVERIPKIVEMKWDTLNIKHKAEM